MSKTSRLHIVPEYTIDERCKCGAPATHKVEEVIESLECHPFTQYLCCLHFSEIFGSVAQESCGLTSRVPDARKSALKKVSSKSKGSA